MSNILELYQIRLFDVFCQRHSKVRRSHGKVVRRYLEFNKYHRIYCKKIDAVLIPDSVQYLRSMVILEINGTPAL